MSRWNVSLNLPSAWEGLRISGRDVFSLSAAELVSLGRRLRRVGAPELPGELQLKTYTYPGDRKVNVFEYVDIEQANAAESGMKVSPANLLAALSLVTQWRRREKRRVVGFFLGDSHSSFVFIRVSFDAASQRPITSAAAEVWTTAQAAAQLFARWPQVRHYSKADGSRLQKIVCVDVVMCM